MSYARKGLDGSDVYVYSDGEIYICHECLLLPATSLVETGFERQHSFEPYPGDMIVHLEKHRAAGHTVPESAIERLRVEQAHARPAARCSRRGRGDIDCSALGTEREAEALRDLMATETDPAVLARMQARLADVLNQIATSKGNE